VRVRIGGWDWQCRCFYSYSCYVVLRLAGMEGVGRHCICPPPPISLLYPFCRGCAGLQELRLNHNQLRTLPAELVVHLRLRILDVGGNPIASFKDIQVGAHHDCCCGKVLTGLARAY
jgi:hypothetical protein